MNKGILKFDNNRFFFEFKAFKFPVFIGKNGITSKKLEGDNATPVGLLPLRKIFFRADRISQPTHPNKNLPVTPIHPNDGWCDDPKHTDYNRHVKLPHSGSFENLWRDDHTYDLCVVLGWNDVTPTPGKGSAIFLHLPPESGATEGCIALSEKNLRLCLGEGLDMIEVQANS